MIRLTDLIAPAFYDLHWDISEDRHTHYWLKGGRGSTKSSFISVEISLGMVQDKQANAICYRKFGNTLESSVYAQLIWAIEQLGIAEYWTINKSPMRLTYRPTGQVVLFRGLDDPNKSKSIKLPHGYFKYIWFEEADQYDDMEEIRKVTQSVIRSSGKPKVFYSYNPPKSVQSWINNEILIPRKDQIVHHSTYLDVPKAWLGDQFLTEAEHLKNVKPDAYRHEYLGEVTGTGGEVFDNIRLEEITEEQIFRFDNIRQGNDWGYAADPAAWARLYYDKTRRCVYLFGEIYSTGLSNRRLCEEVRKRRWEHPASTADSAEPKSIDECQSYGVPMRAAVKGPGSIETGIKFLQDLEAIIIDPRRCPNAAREFATYELERDQHGNFKSKYPDKNNHMIDAVRYAIESDIPRNSGWAISHDIKF